MRRLNFLPHWYIDKANSTQKRFISILVLLFFVINIYLVFIIYEASKKYEGIIYNDKEIGKSISSLNVVSSDTKSIKREEISIIKTYDELKEQVGNGRISDIEIANNEIKVHVEHSGLESYIAFIKELEKSETFKIIDIQPPVENEQYINNYITIKHIK